MRYLQEKNLSDHDCLSFSQSGFVDAPKFFASPGSILLNKPEGQLALKLIFALARWEASPMFLEPCAELCEMPAPDITPRIPSRKQLK